MTPILALCLPQAPPKLEHNKAAGVDYLHKKFQPPSSNRYGDIDDLSKTLTPSFGERVGAGRSKMEHNKVPLEDYLW